MIIFYTHEISLKRRDLKSVPLYRTGLCQDGFMNAFVGHSMEIFNLTFPHFMAIPAYWCLMKGAN